MENKKEKEEHAYDGGPPNDVCVCGHDRMNHAGDGEGYCRNTVCVCTKMKGDVGVKSDVSPEDKTLRVEPASQAPTRKAAGRLI